MAPWGPPEGLEQLQASYFGSAATVLPGFADTSLNQRLPWFHVHQHEVLSARCACPYCQTQIDKCMLHLHFVHIAAKRSLLCCSAQEQCDNRIALNSPSGTKTSLPLL